MFIHLFLSLLSYITACIDQSVTIQSQSRRDSVEREDENGGRGTGEETEWGSKRRVCEAKLFLPTDRLLVHKTWKSQDKTRVEALGSTVYQRVVLL
jgi:hypothetical protein